MDFIKSCWNNRLSSEMFVDKLLMQGNDEINEIVTKKLLEFVGIEIGEPNNLLLSYLLEICRRMPNVFVCCLKEFEDLNQNGILRLLCEVDDDILDGLKTDELNNSKIAINFLKACLKSNNKELGKKALENLALMPTFSCLVASSRYYFFDDILSLRKPFKNLMGISEIPSLIEFPLELLQKAIYCDELNNSCFFARHEIISLVMSLTKKPISFISKNSFFKCYLHLISDFISNQSLYLAYMITNLFVQCFLQIDNKNRNENASVIFSPEDVHSLFQQINYEFMKNSSPLKEIDTYDFIGDVNDLNNIEQLLKEIPYSGIDQSDIIQSIFSHPALSSSFIRLIKERMNLNNIEQSDLYAMKLCEVCIDLKWMLIEQGSFFTFIDYLLDLAIQITDQNKFFYIWILPLTLLRLGYGIGPKSIHDQIKMYVQNYKIPKLRQFFGLLLHDSSFLECAPTFDSDETLCALESAQVLSQLIKKEIGVEDVLEIVNTKKYLWITVLIWDFQNNDSVANKFSNLKPPNSPLINFLFYNVMLRYTLPAKPWFCIMEKMDYPMLTKFIPQSITNIHSLILDQINILSQDTTIDVNKMWTIITSWRAWGEIFSFKELFEVIVFQLILKTNHGPNSDDESILYQTIGLIISILLNENPKFLFPMESIIHIIYNNLDEITSSIGFSYLCIVLILSINSNDWKIFFNKLLQISLEILENDKIIQLPRTVFAISFIRKAMRVKKLEDKILTDNVLSTINDVKDWEVLIDYYILKQKHNSLN